MSLAPQNERSNQDRQAWIDDELSARKQAGLLRTQRVRSLQSQAKTIELNGQLLIDFSSNDYLGLAGELSKELHQDPIWNTNWGSGASPLITGRTEAHQELEQELSCFKHAEAALAFSTGYAANVGAITALTGAGDVIFSDAKNHASIIDGCRLSKANVVIYRHNDIDHLAELLAGVMDVRRRLIVTDTLFSMDGDFAKLPQLAELAETHNAMLLVDEAHATGVFGENGRGLAEHFGCEAAIDVSVGTLSKALGSIGGFITGSRLLIDLLVNKARPYIYSTAMPAVCARAGVLALKRVAAEPQRRELLLSNVGHLVSALREAGLISNGDAGAEDGNSQIIPIMLGHPEKALQLSLSLREAGMNVPAIRPPTVPQQESLLRISLSSQHTSTQLDRLVAGLV